MTSTPVTLDVVEAPEHRHMWYVVGYEWRDQLIGYRCDCGEERFERPRRTGKEGN